MITKELGKISSVKLGYGGYQNAQFGFTFILEGKNSGCGDFIGTWAREPDSYCTWTVEDQTIYWGDNMRSILNLMKDAKIHDFSELAGQPIEMTIENNQLRSWRILTEVK